MPPIILTLLARKGGVGRTTLGMNLAGCYAKDGARVLCIDLDGQASLSRAFLGSGVVESLRPSETTAAIFAGDSMEQIQDTQYDNISLVPAGDALEPLVTTIRRDFARDQMLLREFIEVFGKNFDVVIIDTPPQITASTVWSALTASHFVISPVPADAFGVQSISSVISLVADVQASANPNLQVLGYVLSMLMRNKVNDGYKETLRRLHGAQVFDNELPMAAAFKEAVAERGPISHIKPRTKAAKTIAALAIEIETRIAGVMERSKAA